MSSITYDDSTCTDDSIRMMPMETLYTTDFSGRAYISVADYTQQSGGDEIDSNGLGALQSLSDRLSSTNSTVSNSSTKAVTSTDSVINVDMFVQSIDFQLGEHNMINPYQGNYFGYVFFGKTPLTINVSAELVDNSIYYGKETFMDVYKNALRLTAVSETGNIPSFVCKSFVFNGPWVYLRVVEDANREDVLTIVFTILVTSLEGYGNGTSFVFDFAHGCSDTAQYTDAETSTTVSTSSADTEVTVKSVSV